MSGEYLTRFGQGSVLKIRFQGSVVKTDSCPYLVKDSPDVIKKKTNVADIYITEKNIFNRIIVESGPQEIWIRIRFLEKNGSPSLNFKVSTSREW